MLSESALQSYYCDGNGNPHLATDPMNKSMNFAVGNNDASSSTLPLTKEDLRHAEMIRNKQYEWEKPYWVQKSPLKKGKVLKLKGYNLAHENSPKRLLESGKVKWEKPDWAVNSPLRNKKTKKKIKSLNVINVSGENGNAEKPEASSFSTMNSDTSFSLHNSTTIQETINEDHPTTDDMNNDNESQSSQSKLKSKKKTSKKNKSSKLKKTALPKNVSDNDDSDDDDLYAKQYHKEKRDHQQQASTVCGMPTLSL
jgi:hypothetical protein